MGAARYPSKLNFIPGIFLVALLASFHLCNSLEYCAQSSSGFRTEAHMFLPAGISTTCLSHLARMQSFVCGPFLDNFLVDGQFAAVQFCFWLFMIKFSKPHHLSHLFTAIEAEGLLCLCKGVQGSASSVFNNYVHTEWMSVVFPAVAQQSSALPVPEQSSA